jgi:hypothetical protein
VGEETIQEKQITGEANAKKNDHVKLFEKGGGGHGHKMLGLLNTVQKCRLLDNHLKGTSFIAKDIAI